MATATAQSRGNTIVATVLTTWASTTNAYDGSFGTNPATYATYVNAARSTTGSITIGGYFGAATVPSYATNLSAVTAAIRHFENSTTNITSVTVQLQDSTGANIGSAVAATRATAVATNNLTLGTPTVAQVNAGLRVLVSVVRANTTTSTTFSLDQVDLSFTYTLPDPVANLTDQFPSLDATIWTAGAGASVVTGQLNLAVNGTGTGTLITAIPYALTSSSMYAQLVQPPNVGNGGTWGAMSFTKDATLTDYVGIVWSAGNILLRNQVASAANDTTITYDPLLHKWFRLRHDGTNLYFETASNPAGAWVTRRTLTTGLPTWLPSGYPEFFAGFSGTEPAPGTNIWDNFNYTPPPGQFFTMFQGGSG